MGRFLADSLASDYVSIGIAIVEGYYSAMGKGGLSTQEAQASPPGSYELFLEQIDESVFLLDLRQVKKERSALAKWIKGELTFRNVGALKMDNEFYTTNLTEDFDIIILINESTSTTII